MTEELKQNARIALLRYCSSQLIAHAGYIFTLALIFFGVLDFFRPFFGQLTGIVFTLFIAVTLSGIITIAIYILGRALYWARLTIHIIKVKINKEENNLLEQFLEETGRKVRCKYKLIKYFSRLSKGRLAVLILIFLFFAIILYCIQIQLINFPLA